MKSAVSAAERAMIKGCAQSGVEIVSLGNGSTFRFTPSALAKKPDDCGPSKRTLTSKRKPWAKGFKTWKPASLEYGAYDMCIPMRGDSAELTEARKAYGEGDPQPLRDWLAANKPKAGNMTAIEFKSIRLAAGLTQSQLAKRLRVTDLRTIRRYETGERAISGPVSLLMEQLAHQ